MTLWHTARQTWRAESRMVSAVTAAMVECLHEPPHRARALARRARLEAAQASLITRRCLSRLAKGERPGPEPADHERRQIAAFADYVITEHAPKVVVGIHAGTFVVDVLKVLHALPAGVHVCVPIPARSATALAGVSRWAAAHGKDVRFLPIGRGAARPLYRLHARTDLAFVLLDLGADYGATVTTRLFGAPAELVAGPYLLAQRLRASIVYVDTAARSLSFDRPLDDCARASGHTTLEALAERFAHRFEAAVAHEPTRWLRWHTMAGLRAPASAGPRL